MLDQDQQDHAAALLRDVLEETRGQSRRVFLNRLSKAAAGSALLSAFGSTLTAHAQSGGALTTMGFGGIWDEQMNAAFFKAFSDRTGVPVRAIPYSTARLLAMAQSGNMQVDFVNAAGMDTPLLISKDMAAPIDWKIVDRGQLTPNQLQYGDKAVGSIALSYVMAYNKKRWPGSDHPKNWRDFWNVDKFPGPRSLGRYTAYPTLEFALLADGVPADKLYPLDLDRAFRSLDKIKKHVKVWWEGGGQQQQMMVDQEVDLLYAWSGRVTALIVGGKAPYEIVWDESAYQADGSAWIIMKGAPNMTQAMQLMNWLGRAEPQAAFARGMYYGPTNLKAYDLLDPKLAKLLPTHPENASRQFKINFDWWLKNNEVATKRFESWLQS